MSIRIAGALVAQERAECAKLVAYLGRAARVEGRTITTDEIAAAVASGQRAPEGTQEIPRITDAELVILLANEQGCSNYVGEDDVLCALEHAEPEERCECLRVVRALRAAIETGLIT